MDNFKDYARYYDVFYNDKDYYKEAKDIKEILSRYSCTDCSIIDFGCGTGKHDIQLAKMGYSCHGIDISEEMIGVALQNTINSGLNVTFQVADIRNYIPLQKYSAVISLFHVMSYNNSNDNIIDAFRCARDCVESGGIFIFDIWYGPGVLTDRPCVRIKRAEDSDYEMIRLAVPEMFQEKNVVHVNYDVIIIDKHSGKARQIKETHCMRYFFVPEIMNYLSLAGFDMLECIDCNTLSETDFSSWTAYFIAKAI